MRVLVTGGTGFIGSEVVRQLLDAGHAVRIFSRRKDVSALFTGNVEVAQGDLSNARSLIEALAETDVLYHIGEIKNTSKAASEKNVSLLEDVLGQIKRTSVKRIVFVSSISVAGIPSTIPADEDTAPGLVLNDHYTECKRRSEKLLRENAGNVEYAVIRPAPVYGPGSRYLGRLIRVLDRLGPVGIPFPGNAGNLAPLIHVRDLAQAISRAGTEPAASGQTFNLTDGMRHSWREFLETIAECLGKKLRIIPVPRLLLQLAALPLDLFSVFLGVSLDPVSYVSYFSADLYFNNSRARELLGWQPRYSLIEGVREMTAFYGHGR
ncbi:MAG: NAD(P)-dependent oxidoreductase [Nitrospirota bacterium]|nr:NAD(P)-dependent oxidoreductase [Nitrospirota bacterium]